MSAARRRRAIRKVYCAERYEIDLSKLTLKDCIFSLAVLHANRSSKMYRIAEAGTFQPPLSPLPEFDTFILKHLYERGIIGVDPNASEDCFVFDQHGKPTQFYTGSVKWLLRDSDALFFANGLENLISRATFPSDWVTSVETLASEIACFECLGFSHMLVHENPQLRWPQPSEWKTVLLRAVKVLPICQILPLIVTAANQTLGGALNSNESGRFYGGLWLEKLDALVEQVRTQEIVPRSCNRVPQCPRSVVSVIFYDKLLRGKDDGFYKLPNSFHLKPERPVVPPIPLNKGRVRRAIELSPQVANEVTGECDSASEESAPSPLLVFLAGLSARDRAQIAAVMLIGRGDESPANFDEIVWNWTRPLDWTQSEYLAEKKHLRKWLEAGLKAILEIA
jgi:hypothetical protein